MTGKIARLPHKIREQINRRLQDGEPGRLLLAWLNALPQTLRLLTDQFEGRPINQANLSAWRNGGFRQWLGTREILQLVREQLPDKNAPAAAAAAPSVAERASQVLAARYAVMMTQWQDDVTGSFRRQLRALHDLCVSVTHLRRRDQAAARLELTRDQFAWQFEQAVPAEP